MASTVNVVHVQFSCFFFFFLFFFFCFLCFFLFCFFFVVFFFVFFVFLFSLIQRSVSVLFMIISYPFNFTGFCFHSEALLWFCYQSKFVKRVSLPRGG